MLPFVASGLKLKERGHWLVAQIPELDSSLRDSRNETRVGPPPSASHRRARPDAPPLARARHEAEATRVPSHDEIAVRAYEIYLTRGAAPGSDLDNWLEAEWQLRGSPGAQT